MKKLVCKLFILAGIFLLLFRTDAMAAEEIPSGGSIETEVSSGSSIEPEIPSGGGIETEPTEVEDKNEASKNFFTKISLVKKTSRNAATFNLEFNLGNEIIKGVEKPAEADFFYIEELDYFLYLDNLNEDEIEIELEGLKNKKYHYYIQSVNNFKYEGYFEVKFVKAKEEIKPKVTFKGFPKKAVFEGTKVVLTMKTDNVKSEMTFNGKKISDKKIGGGGKVI